MLFFLGGIENILEPVPLWIDFIEFLSVPPHENNKPSSKNHLIEGKPPRQSLNDGSRCNRNNSSGGVRDKPNQGDPGRGVRIYKGNFLVHFALGSIPLLESCQQVWQIPEDGLLERELHQVVG